MFLSVLGQNNIWEVTNMKHRWCLFKSNWKVTQRNKYTCGMYPSLQAVKVRGPEDTTLANYELRREITAYDCSNILCGSCFIK